MPDEESLNKFSTDIDVNAISTEIATKLALEGKISPTATEGEVMAIVLPMVMEEVLPQMKDIVYKADTKTETEEITIEQIDGKWKVIADELSEEIFDISSLVE
jgi:peroxiredoxin family protein